MLTIEEVNKKMALTVGIYTNSSNPIHINKHIKLRK